MSLRSMVSCHQATNSIRPFPPRLPLARAFPDHIVVVAFSASLSFVSSSRFFSSSPGSSHPTTSQSPATQQTAPASRTTRSRTQSQQQQRIPSRRGPRVTLTLEHFVQRGRVLALYRAIVRGINRLDASQRGESRAFARGEFERNRNVTDLSHIRYLISTGKTEWEAMHRYVSK